MKTNLRVLVLLVCVIGSLAGGRDELEAYADECIAEISPDMENPLASDASLESIPLVDFDDTLKELLHCGFEKQGSIKDGVIQINELIEVIDELFPFHHHDVEDAVSLCEHETADNPVELVYNTAVCIQDYLSEIDC